MNVIVICSDTFRYDHLGFLGRQPVLTPNLDQLARESASFADFRLCSFPTILNRIEVFSGRRTFPLIDWGPLPFHYPVLSEVFQHHGFTTALVADNAHLMKEEFGFGRGFDFVKNVPGQIDDRFQPDSAPMIELPCPVEKLDPRQDRLDRYRRNARWYHDHHTTPAEMVFQESMRWLDTPREKFFLWMDVFDPHEPWDPPQEFLKPYPWDQRGDTVVWPRAGKASNYSEPDLANIRSLYKAEVSEIDFWVGKMMAHLRERNLLETTVVIFCSDHGYYFGEHNLLGKLGLERPNVIYEELGHIPLLIRHPKGLAAGKTIPGLCQPPDLFATALDFAGIPPVTWMQGNSLASRLNGQASQQRFAVGGCYPCPRKGHVGCLTIWSDEWTFIYSPFDGIDGSELYHRPSDPGEIKNLISSRREIAEAHYALLCEWLDQFDLSDARRRQILHAKGYGWIEGLRQKLWLRRNRRHYERHFANYARGEK